MHYEFCTLFDKNYLTRGLSLYNSLLEHCPDFKLWILCMDDDCFQMLKKLELEKAELIQLKNFEDPKLLKAKCNRSHGEYCWACTPSLILYVLNHNKNIDHVAYLDSDLFFYSSPDPIYKEFSDQSIMIIPHRFLPHKKHLEKSGIYNVGMLIFKNNNDSKNCLEWWRKKCNESTELKPKKGIIGDQKYLDEFPEKFPNVHILQHIGANVAPWNIGNYKITKKENNIYINDNLLIFYHFYQFKIYPYSIWLPPCPWSHYIEKSSAYKHIYRQYIKSMYKSIKTIQKTNKLFPVGTIQKSSLKNIRTSNMWTTLKKIIKYYMTNSAKN